MFQVEFKNPSPDETLNNIALHNLKESDKVFNLQLFKASSIGWLIANNTKGFHDLEATLRLNNLNTHLFCKLPDDSIKMPNDYEKELIYECVMSCKPKDQSLAEVLKFYTYDDNLKKLELAGILSSFKNEHEEISTNKKKINIKIIDVKDAIFQIEQQIEMVYGQKPIVVDMTGNKTLFGFYISTLRVSNYGIKIDNNVCSIVEIS